MATHAEFGKKTTSLEVANAFSSVVAGKTVLITGISPNGLGEAVATALAKNNPAKLIFTARQLSKAESVASSIGQSQTLCPPIQCVQLDLSSFASVRAASSLIIANNQEIDILINNAGVMALPQRTLSSDGHEMHFATNFLGHWLLTNFLNPNIASGGRVVNVTSGGYMVCPIRFHDIEWEGKVSLPPEEQPDMDMVQNLGIGTLATHEEYNGMLAYLHSNAATMLFTKKLSEILQGRSIAVLSAAPGVVVTELQRHIGGFRNATMEYKDAAQGAASFLVAALDPALQLRSGAYVDDCQVAEVYSAHIQDTQVANKLWALAEEMTGEHFSGV